MSYTQDEFNEWRSLVEWMSTAKKRENELRVRIFDNMFADPIEGTNKLDLAKAQILGLPHAHTVKGTFVVNRKIDEPVLRANADALYTIGVSVDRLVKMKPELVKSEYNTLTNDQKKQFDTCLIITAGTPQLEIVEVKRGL